MKYLLILLIAVFSVSVNAQDLCKVETQDVNTPVPSELKDAEIIIRTKDGKEQKVSANEFKVVKRKQQFKVKETVIKESCICTGVCKRFETEVVYVKKEKDNRNLILLGFQKGYTNLDSSTSGNTATLYYRENLIFDLSYLRRQVIGNFGLGIGLSTDRGLRGTIGYEF